ncbi:hypothetical protein HDV05_003511 [Chytridiales sp. JEL 0842]|nr:hypothetical protein HDV05_003511 [Chytridiales sp. JEL 0842]
MPPSPTITQILETSLTRPLFLTGVASYKRAMIRLLERVVCPPNNGQVDVFHVPFLDGGRTYLEKLYEDMGINLELGVPLTSSSSSTSSLNEGASECSETASSSSDTQSDSTRQSSTKTASRMSPIFVTKVIEREIEWRFQRRNTATILIIEASDIILHCNSRKIPARQRRREGLDSMWRLVNSRCLGLVPVIVTAPFTLSDQTEGGGGMDLSQGVAWKVVPIENKNHMRVSENLRIVSLRGRDVVGEDGIYAWSIQMVPAPPETETEPSETDSEVEVDKEDDILTQLKPTYPNPPCTKALFKLLSETPLDYYRKVTPRTLLTELCNTLLSRLRYFTSKQWTEHQLALDHPIVLRRLAKSQLGNASVTERVAGGKLLLRLISRHEGNTEASDRKYKLWRLVGDGPAWVLQSVYENLKHANGLRHLREDEGTWLLVFRERVGLYQVSGGLLGHFSGYVPQISGEYPSASNEAVRKKATKVMDALAECFEVVLHVWRRAENEMPGTLGRALSGLIASIPNVLKASTHQLAPKRLRNALGSLINLVQDNGVLNTGLRTLKVLEEDVRKEELAHRCVSRKCRGACMAQILHPVNTGIVAR